MMVYVELITLIQYPGKKPRTIREMKKDALMHEYFLYCQKKAGITFKQFVSEFWKKNKNNQS